MTDKLKGFMERHNYKITLTIIKFLKILGKNHCEEAITEMQKYYYKQLFIKKIIIRRKKSSDIKKVSHTHLNCERIAVGGHKSSDRDAFLC